jgi:hypothetical protein
MSSSAQRLGSSEKVSSVSGLLLLIVLWFDWFGVQSSDDSFNLFEVRRSAWDALEYIPIILLVTAIAALAVAILRLLGVFQKPSIHANAVVAALGILSSGLILFRIIDPPNFGSVGSPFGKISFEGTVQVPMFLALLAGAGVAVGGCLALLQRSVTETAARHRVDGRRRLLP